MRGAAHVILTFLAVFSVSYPLYLQNAISAEISTIIIVGAVLGSLVPDIDASDSAILHGELKIFGKFFKRVVYPPVSYTARKVFNLKKEHRGFMHSILGVMVFNAFLLPFVLIVSTIYIFSMGILLY